MRKEVVRNTYVQTEWKMGSIHFCGDEKTVEVVLRTIISVNQLSIYGAVADMCDELACRISDCSEPGKIGRLMSRVYSSLKRPIVQSERMDSWEHEDPSSFGGARYSSFRTLRNRDHDTILIR